jgi:hypothetical protein
MSLGSKAAVGLGAAGFVVLAVSAALALGLLWGGAGSPDADRASASEAGGEPRNGEASAGEAERTAETPKPAPEAAEAGAGTAGPGVVPEATSGTESPGAEAPNYEVLRRLDGPGMVALGVRTAETGEEGLRRIAEDVRESHPTRGVLLVDFYESPQAAADSEESGFALVFGSLDAALAPDLPYSEEQIEAIFAEEDGIRVVSYEGIRGSSPDLS